MINKMKADINLKMLKRATVITMFNSENLKGEENTITIFNSKTKRREGYGTQDLFNQIRRKGV